jgi:pimeloyl-ACP methyl ester carboxylesterase
MLSPQSWRADVAADYAGPRIALIHGLMAGSHMEKHLLRFVREAGYQDATLYSNHLRPSAVAKDLQEAAKAGRPIAMIGYSQGGSQVVKVANCLNKKGIKVKFVVSIAAGGYGRLFPAQWGFDMRKIPANIERYLNFYSPIDKLGSDVKPERNIAKVMSADTHLENISYSVEDAVDHLAVSRCYPVERIQPVVQELFLNRLLEELAKL